MRKLYDKYKKILLFSIVYLSIIFGIFYPVFLQGKIPISSNLLVSFYNPWLRETFPGWEGGVPNKPTGIDDLRIYIPQRNFTNHNFLQGKIPFWNPYVFSGNYHIGQSELAVFYPLFLLSLINPLYIGWTALMVIEPILTGLGMFLFLRLIVKNFSAALCGSIIFALSGVVLVRMVDGLSVGHTLIWISFVFYGLEGYLQKYKIRYLYITLIALSLSLLAGWFQFTFYIFALGFLYSLFRVFGRSDSVKSWKNWLVLLPFILLPIVTSFHILSALQAFSDSPRGLQTEKFLLNLHLMPIQHLLTYIFPDFWGNPGTYNFFGRSEYKESILYIGFIPLFIALLSLFRKWEREIKFFGIATLISLILGVDNPLSRFFLSFPIPIAQSFLPNRIFFVATFSLSVLAAFGIRDLLSGKIKNQTISLVLKILATIIIIADIYLLSGLVINHLVKTESPGKLSYVNSIQSELFKIGMVRAERDFVVQVKNSILGNFIFVFLLVLFFVRERIKPLNLLIVIILFTIISQVYFAWKYIPFSNPQFFFPDHPVFSYLKENSGINRFIGVGDTFISPNVPLYYGLYSADGVGAMYPQNYAQLLRYAQSRGEDTKNVSRVEVNPIISSKKLFMEEDPYILRFMQLAGIKYIIKLKDEDIGESERFTTNGTEKFTQVWENAKWQIFQYENALPRFFWTQKYITNDDKNNSLRLLFNPKFDPSTIILDKVPKLSIGTDSKGTVKLTKYTPNEIVFESDSTGNGLLFLSDNYTKNFKAKIDGKGSEIIKANYTFRAIPVPAGKHTIYMYYDQTIVILGLLIGGSLILIGVVLTFITTQRKLLIF